MLYIELVIIEDFIYNYVILFGVSILLRRITNLKKILLSSTIGTFSLVFLLFNISKQLNFIISIAFSLIMSLVSFSYKDILYTLKNIFYMYCISVFLAGGIYLINTNILPQSNSYLLNIIILILLAPIITTIYIKSIKKIKNHYSNCYKVDIYLNEVEKITTNSFLDTGNKLIDPYKKRPIILVKKSLIDTGNKKIILVPYNTVNNNDLLKCIIPKKIYIHNIGYRKNFLIGLVNEINIEGVDCILNQQLLERI